MSKKIIIIGGGPGGYVAAIRAAELGAEVTVIEEKTLGGTCLNRGCIPTKALYRNAEVLNTLKNIEEFGIDIESYSVNVERIQNRKNKVVNQLVEGVQQLLKGNNIEVINGTATFIDRNTLEVKDHSNKSRIIKGDYIIIASGSEPSIPPIPGANLDGIYTSEDILNFDEIPETLAVVGGGVIGMELACVFNALGSKVTVVEYLPNILAQVDSDITKRLVVSLKKKGITIHVGTAVQNIKSSENGYIIEAVGKKGQVIIEAEKVLLSTGRAPRVEGLNLEKIGVTYTRKGIDTDEDFRTNVSNIYAIGDVNGKSMLAHAASHEGIIVAQNIMGIKEKCNLANVPSCIFLFPEVASVGITEDEAKKKGIPYNTSKFMFGANGKALALGEGEGFVKVISQIDNPHRPGEDIIIGVHIMGPHGSDLIHEGALALSNNMKVKDIASTIHAHPTLSEAFAEAVMALGNKAIHIMPKR